MSRRVQAFRSGLRAVFVCARRPLVAAATVVLVLSGCASRGLDLDSLAVDATITTNATGAGKAAAPDAERLSDEVSIRNAVSSANLDELPDGRIHWANPDTGSRGEISRIVERREDTTLCRRFIVSRESFQGVALHSAEVCLAQDGSWFTRVFEAA
ncbi:hypothetical protein BSQ44_07235 [Aquibium oceanicum]|uniref:Surface antigen domain-containing protein n=1 Tax=Aquibium oceanicum TaxID=1670800 RepID=A0A1L3SP52_9HYPH|nr:hypothetical protein BSQ44_07235 [Aquibium oceanicum]